MTEKFVRVGTGVLLFQDGNVLLGKRKGSHGAGLWAPPGGHIEFGESFEENIKREALEETGLELDNVRRADFADGYTPAWGTHYVTLFFTADIVGGKLENREPHKCEGWGWYKWGDWPGELFIPFANLVAGGWRPAQLDSK